MRGKRNSRRAVVRSVALAVFCSGVLVGVADSATAAPVELGLDYRCAVGPGLELTVRAQVKGVLPDESIQGRVNTVPHYEPAFIDIDLTLGGDGAALAAAGRGLRIDGDSTATLGVTIVGPTVTRSAEAALSFAPTRITPSGGLKLKAAGGFPALDFVQSADYAFHLDDLKLSLRLERADGTPLRTIDSTCTHDPGQNDKLATLTSEPSIVEHPVRPTELRVTASTPTSVSLAWHAVPWWFETAGYDVYLDGVKVAFVTEKAATLTGLAPDSQHRVKIVTRDRQGFSSPKSQGLVFATPPGS